MAWVSMASSSSPSRSAGHARSWQVSRTKLGSSASTSCKRKSSLGKSRWIRHSLFFGPPRPKAGGSRTSPSNDSPRRAARATYVLTSSVSQRTPLRLDPSQFRRARLTAERAPSTCVTCAPPAAQASVEPPVCANRLSTRGGRPSVSASDSHTARSQAQFSCCSGKAPIWPLGPGCSPRTKPTSLRSCHRGVYIGRGDSGGGVRSVDGCGEGEAEDDRAGEGAGGGGAASSARRCPPQP
mmetsp:Transcript_29381/g.59155  ORF Transcript_29381/g.59155 Transcript_29381/m.59155 type:complete len:239 (-) Transcript_29381:246-962(-)